MEGRERNEKAECEGGSLLYDFLSQENEQPYR